MESARLLQPGGRAANVPLDTLVMELKESVFRMGEAASGGYIAQGLCAAEVIAALFYRVLRLNPEDPKWELRDRFVLSVGHYAIGVYAALARLGFFKNELLDTYSLDGSLLEMIATEVTPGIEVGGGSLGQGLSQGIGMALSAKRKEAPWRTYVLMSDGELEEGQTWEAAMVASHHKLGNLTLIVDVNGVQADGRIEDVTGVRPITHKWLACGWNAIEIDGNDTDAVLEAFHQSQQSIGRPTVIVSNTRMGNGVSFLENRPDVHYIKWSAEDTRRALMEIKTAEVRRS